MSKTFEEQLAEKVVQRQSVVDNEQSEALIELLDNSAFIESQRCITAKAIERKRLNTTIKQLNTIKPFVAADGHKYSVKVYPISFFNTGLAQILGIIAGSKSAFTDDLELEYSAITGIDMIELREAHEALGSPIYMTKDGLISESIPSNLPKLKLLLSSIFLKLNIHEFNTKELTQDKLDLWFAKAEIAVSKKQVQRESNAEMHGDDFTMVA